MILVNKTWDNVLLTKKLNQNCLEWKLQGRLNVLLHLQYLVQAGEGALKSAAPSSLLLPVQILPQSLNKKQTEKTKTKPKQTTPKALTIPRVSASSLSSLREGC